jgi:hypothetical protein
MIFLIVIHQRVDLSKETADKKLNLTANRGRGPQE